MTNQREREWLKAMGFAVLLFLGALGIVALLMHVPLAHGAEYTRSGGTADFACCADPQCATVLTQRAREWSAKDDCVALTDKDGVTRYVRQWPMRVFKSGTAPPTACPAKPGDESQPGVCPAGTTGSWTQTRTYSSAAAPTCWTAGEWLPAAAPSGACVTPPPAVPNAPADLAASIAPNAGIPANSNVTLTWGAVAGVTTYEVHRCTGATCTNFAFVDDVETPTFTALNQPPGITWRYRVRAWKPTTGPYSATLNVTTPTAPVTPPPQANGSSLIEWKPVTLNSDGTPATVAGYLIHYSTVGVAGPSLNQFMDVKQLFTIAPCIQVAGDCAQFRVTDLPPGNWAFAVSTYDTLGRYGQQSNFVTKQIP